MEFRAVSKLLVGIFILTLLVLIFGAGFLLVNPSDPFNFFIFLAIMTSAFGFLALNMVFGPLRIWRWHD
jgi:hypothetical protein